MGKGPRHRSKAAAAGDADMSDSEISVEEGDIEALARSSLRAGETILGAGQTAENVESRGICNAPLILQKLQDIEYKVPPGAKRVPWVDTLCVDGWREVPKDVKAKDGVKLEGAFMEIATDACKEAYRRLRVMKVPSSRPTDFYAEMLRTDAQMFRVRARAAEEQRRIKIVEQRKTAQASKKFAKQVRVKRLEDKAGEKRKTLDDIADWRNRNKQDKRNADDQDLDDILDKQRSNRSGEDEDGNEQKKKGKHKVSKKQMAKDKKWGFGGKKRWKKSNDADSTRDMSASPWARKGKGKGKGKSGGKNQSKTKQYKPEQKVWIGNLSESTTYKTLHEHMKQADAKWCEAFDKKGKGTGVACFATADAAQAAISMLNGSMLDGSAIQVDTWEKQEKA